MEHNTVRIGFHAFYRGMSSYPRRIVSRHRARCCYYRHGDCLVRQCERAQDGILQLRPEFRYSRYEDWVCTILLLRSSQSIVQRPKISKLTRIEQFTTFDQIGWRIGDQIRQSQQVRRGVVCQSQEECWGDHGCVVRRRKELIQFEQSSNGIKDIRGIALTH